MRLVLLTSVLAASAPAWAQDRPAVVGLQAVGVMGGYGPEGVQLDAGARAYLGESGLAYGELRVNNLLEGPDETELSVAAFGPPAWVLVEAWPEFRLMADSEYARPMGGVRLSDYLGWVDVSAGVALPLKGEATLVPTVSALAYLEVWWFFEGALGLQASADWTEGEPWRWWGGLTVELHWRGNDVPW